MPGAVNTDLPTKGHSLFAVGLWPRQAPQPTDALEDPLQPPSSPLPRQPPPRRSRTVPLRGRALGSRPARAPYRDIAWDAVLRGAAADHSERPLRLTGADLRQLQRRPRRARLVVVLVDLSGSMGTRLMALARRTAEDLLAHAHVHRDRLALIGFRGRRAHLLVAPTNRAEALRRPLSRLQTGGTTPLAAGLRRALGLLTQEQQRRRAEPREPVLLVISDGHGNVGRRPGRLALDRELAASARALSRAPGLRRLLIDTTEAGKPDGAARELAAHLHAHRLPLAPLQTQGRDPLPYIVAWLDAP